MCFVKLKALNNPLETLSLVLLRQILQESPRKLVLWCCYSPEFLNRGYGSFSAWCINDHNTVLHLAVCCLFDIFTRITIFVDFWGGFLTISSPIPQRCFHSASDFRSNLSGWFVSFCLLFSLLLLKHREFFYTIYPSDHFRIFLLLFTIFSDDNPDLQWLRMPSSWPNWVSRSL